MRLLLGIALIAFASAASPASAVVIDTVPIRNAGNAPDAGNFGAVAYDFRIGETEVTNAQYVEFLNSVDRFGQNTLELYSNMMSTDAQGGINLFPGASTGAKYQVKPGRANQPVTWVSWFDAVRFTNWLHNGQGIATTENGAYQLVGGTPIPTNSLTIARQAGAQWFLPTNDEWYKSAYHQNDGATGNYWNYATASDSVPYSDAPPGSDAPDATEVANFIRNDSVANGYNDGFAVTGSTLFVGTQNYLTDVGAYTSAAGPYGTFDQAGNVQEWIESPYLNGVMRAVRGGSWNDQANILEPLAVLPMPPATQDREFGFRVAAMVPEPSTLLLITTPLMVVIFRRRREHSRA